MKIFNLPDLGEGLPDAEIHEWHVKEGDTVKQDQIMVSMETAKAVVEVPAPRSGTIIKFFGKPGDIIETGQPLVEFEDDNSTVGTVSAAEKTEKVANTPATVTSNSGDVKAAPPIRALAKKLNIDLNTIKGSGTDGQITREDVEKAGQNHTTSTAQSGNVEPVRGVRRAMVTSMTQSHQEVVPVTLVDDADIDAWPKGTDITARIIRAIAQASAAEPALNVWFDSKNMQRTVHQHVHLGVAMDAGDGLFVPVIKDVQNKSAEELRTIINTYKQQVTDREIATTDLTGATISMSNFGVFAGRYANPIIVPPCVAIIGIGKIRSEVVAIDGKPVVHRILPLSVSIDHRCVTGGEASRFLGKMIEDLQTSH